jgi:hypothetical protein
MTKAEQIMERCRVGTRNYDEANNLHADCYRVIGKLLKTIEKMESQELKQINVKEFVHMVEGKEDLIGRPVYFAQWPNGSTHPPQRTWVGLTPEEFHEACWESYVDPVTGECSTGDREYAVRWTEAKLKEKNT